MRKGRDGEKRGENKGAGKLMKIMDEIVASNVVASQLPNADRLQRRPLVPKWLLVKVWTLTDFNKIARANKSSLYYKDMVQI